MKYRITQKDFMLANRKAAREEEIESHGKQIIFRNSKNSYFGGRSSKQLKLESIL